MAVTTMPMKMMPTIDRIRDRLTGVEKLVFNGVTLDASDPVRLYANINRGADPRTLTPVY